MWMKVKARPKLRVRQEPNFESCVKGFLFNKMIVDVDEPVNGWCKLNAVIVRTPDGLDRIVPCNKNYCYVYSKYLKKVKIDSIDSAFL